MIPASNLIGHSAAKWSKTQPHEGIWWTNKLHKGVGGSNRAYYAYSPSKKLVVCVQQLWNSEKRKVVWQVDTHRPAFDSLEEAREYTREMLNE